MRAILARSPGLGRLLAGQVPADAADWLAYVAVATLLSYTWQAPAVAFAWFGVALGLPYILIGPLAGVLVDRLPIRAVLIWSNLGRGAAFAAMTLAPGWQTLLTLLFLAGVVDSFFSPAKQAALQALAGRADRMAANGASRAINQTSKVVMPGLGGLLLTLVAPEVVFAINGCVSLLAVAIFATMPSFGRRQGSPVPDGFLGELRAGLSLVRRSRVLSAALTLSAAGFFAIFLYDTLLPPLVRAIGFGPATLGWSFAAFGAGGIAGSVLVARRGNGHGAFALIAAGAATSGILTLLTGMAEVLSLDIAAPVLLAVFAMNGTVAAAFFVPIRTVVQDHTDDRSIARVTALLEAANAGALLTAPFLGAAIAARFSPGWAFVAGGGLLVLTGVAAWTRRRAA